MTDAEWFLPIGKPRPNMVPTATVRFDWDQRTGLSGYQQVPVLGPPIHRDTLAAPLSAEARAVLEAAESWMHGAASDHEVLCACRAYARSLTPPDPLARVRHLLEKIVAHTADDTDRAHARAALDALAKLGDR